MKSLEIARLFSLGEFDAIPAYIDSAAIWNVVGDKQLKGKTAIIDRCKQVRDYFDSVTTNFTIRKTITDGDTVVILGTAEFLRNDQRISLIEACDVYQFTPDGLIRTITSYCIPEK